jgi:23S rRNA (uracil1939-C5)-methyltransferase
VGLSVGAVVALDVERPVAGGRMLARHDGQVVFLAGAIPGETVRARVTRVARGTVYADTIDVATASPDRRAGLDGGCGGAVYGHIDYPRQVALKAAIIEDAWRRIGKLPLPGPVRVVASHERGYRSRARLHARDGRVGFYREGTHQLCDAAGTGQLADATVEWLNRFSSALRGEPARALAALDVVENAAGTERACHLHLHDRVAARQLEPLAEGLTGLSAGVSTAEADVEDRHSSGGHGIVVVAGDPAVADGVDVLNGGRGARVLLRHNVRSFFQGNRFLLTPLVQMVVDAVVEGGVLDLFAGTGLFGLSAAALGRTPVTLVEGDRSSGADLEANTAANAPGIAVERQSVEGFLATPRAGIATWVVDPPRSGLPDGVRAAALRDRPERVVYVSCDPATLARDVRTLAEGGYEPRALTGLDLFPSTAHVEAVCVLDRVR